MPSEASSIAKPASLIPTSREEALAIQRWIDHGGPDPEPVASELQVARHLKFLSDTLPSQNVGSDAGRNRTAVYYRMLEGYSDQALSYMSRRACAELDWFPTPHQCLAILKDYIAPTTGRESARMHCQAFWQHEMEDFHTQLRAGPVDQVIIDSQTDQWKRIAENAGLLRWSDGKFVQRFKALTTPTPPTGHILP